MIYGNRSNGNQHGLVLTKPLVVEKMLDRIGYVPTIDLSKKRVIEPAAGDGAFAIPIIERLFESSVNFNFSFQESLKNITFYEIDNQMTGLLSARINKLLIDLSVNLPAELIRTEDYLLADVNPCDIIVGNPPYVRHENIPDSKKKLYRSYFKTFTHRSDLYIAFYEKSLLVLKQDGILSFICSNRWLKNQYGFSLRKLIGQNFSLNEVIDLEGTCPFEEDVLAYPAITTISKSEEKVTPKYIKIKNIEELKDLEMYPSSTRVLNTQIARNWFSISYAGEGCEKHIDTIENQGFKIGIGVATGADKFYINENFRNMVENELLLPILTSKDLRGNKLNWSGKYLLNPFAENGDLINLNHFPKAKNYFNNCKEELIKRHIAKKDPNKWYKTIDRISPALLTKDKIILPDISGNSYLFIDKGHYYPHHNLYYITGRSYEKLVLLASTLMSEFVRNQLDELGNKMNGGYIRWQSQNIKKLRVPIIDSIPSDLARKLHQAYHLKDYQEINRLINSDSISNFKATFVQATLFDKI